jgi:hypothetical protein
MGMRHNPFEYGQGIPVEDLLSSNLLKVDLVVNGGISFMVYDLHSNDFVALALAWDIVEAAKPIYNDTFKSMRAYNEFFKVMKHDLCKPFGFKHGQCVEFGMAATASKYMKEGVMMWLLRLQTDYCQAIGYQYMHVYLVQPVTIMTVMSRKTNYLKSNYYVYSDFEFEGQRPLKNISFKNFKNFNKPPGCFALTHTIPYLPEHTRAKL